MARYFKGAGDSLCRLLSFFQDLLRAWHTSAGRLERTRRQRADDREIGLAQGIGARFPRGRRFHHSEWLDTNAIDRAPSRIGRGRLGPVVSLAIPAALSDVLGRALGLSAVAFRRASRTGGQPHRAEPARSALHRYSDELHVPQRGVVVFLHADPVLFDLSPALLGGAPFWTIALFVNRVCRWIFCALSVARRLAPKWIVGPRRFRGLPVAGVRSRNVAGNVALPIKRARWNGFSFAARDSSSD